MPQANYHYDPETKEYLNQSNARLDPMETEVQGEDVFLCPKHATHIAPPSLGANQVAVFDEENQEWDTMADFRGSVYYGRYGDENVIEEIGETIPEGPDYSTTPPPSELKKPKLHYSNWVEDGLIYRDALVETKADVDALTRQAIIDLGEEKAKTMKLIAGDAACPEWDAFVAARNDLVNEGNQFVADNNLS